jgi:hypothetical protein
MKRIDDYLLEQMGAAIEKKQELELQLMIAEKEYQAIQAAYRAYVDTIKEANGND